MTLSFENLWNQCEDLHKQSSSDDSINLILDELIMKINLYRLLDEKKEIELIERQKIKSRTLGEILLTITNLSLKDDINVFDALLTAHKFQNSGFSLPKL